MCPSTSCCIVNLSRNFRLSHDPHHLRDRNPGQLPLLQECSFLRRCRAMQNEADQDGPDTAEDVSPEDAKHAEPDQSVGDDLAGRSGDPDACFLFPGKTPDDRFQDATAVKRIARQQIEQCQDEVDVGQPFR